MSIPGKVPGSFSPAVPFQEPSSPEPGPISANTNFGRATNTENRSMPVTKGGGEDPINGTFGEGVCKPEWGKR